MKSLDPHVGMKNAEPPKGRNRTIDALRVPAAIAVIALHVGPYAELPHGLGMDLRALCRWAVPYFALLSGFYVARDWSEVVVRSQKQVLGLFKIAVVSALVFAPLTVVEFGWADGSYYHLWFRS